MIKKDIKMNKRNGFVLLFAIVLTSIILAIALGVTSIALKEAQFSTSAKDTNEAFFAADTGAECALYWDKTSNNNVFGSEIVENIFCSGFSINLENQNPVWYFTIPKLGVVEKGCAVVSINKPIDSGTGVVSSTTITSKGYNFCIDGGGSVVPAPNSVERQLEVTY